jgi:hypothetical protein
MDAASHSIKMMCGFYRMLAGTTSYDFYDYLMREGVD